MKLSLKDLRGALINALMLPLAYLVPRVSRNWIFGHQGGLFAGNSKYLFLWVSVHRKDIRAVWLADDDETRDSIARQGFLAYRRWSWDGIIATLRSRVMIYCHGLSDVNARLSAGAFLVNLWHGVGLKSTMFGDKTGIMSHYRNNWSNWLGRIIFYQYLKMPDVLVTTSDFTQNHFSEQFMLPKEQCPQLGYPRLDCGIDPMIKRIALDIDSDRGFEFNPDRLSEVYLYMPTWRDTGREFVTDALPDLDQLSKTLQACDAILYVKLHPWTRDSWTGDRHNIRSWPDEVEVYSYLDKIDGMITDYSSILYDFLYDHDGGAILYTFDLDSYLSNDHSMLYPFAENVAGIRVNTFDELCEVIGSGAALKADPEAIAVRQKFWGDHSAPASARVVSYIERAIGLPARHD